MLRSGVKHAEKWCQTCWRIVRHRVKRDNKFNIYFAYTYSKILYAIEVYGTTSCELLNKLQIQQNRSIKMLFNKHYRMHTSDLYRELNILKVHLIQNVHIASIVFKHKLNSLPTVIKNYITCSSEIHTDATRNTSKLHVRQPLNDNGKK